jgi:AcrR family transcriptional regulator
MWTASTASCKIVREGGTGVDGIAGGSNRTRESVAGKHIQRRPTRRGRPPAGGERAEEMMRAALDLFAERNFASVTIKDIATSLGVNTALLYYYFDNKEDLFRATIERTVAQAFARFRSLRSQRSEPAEILSDWLDNHIDLFDPIRKFVKISLDYAGSHRRSASIDRSIRLFYEEEARVLSECIQAGIDGKVFCRVDPQQVAQFISGYLDGLMVRAVIQPGFDLPAAVGHFRGVLWDMLDYASPRGRRLPRRASGHVTRARRASS